MKFKRQAAAAISKANQILGITKPFFELLGVQVLPLLLRTLIWDLPTQRIGLRDGDVIWGPFNKEDHLLVEQRISSWSNILAFTWLVMSLATLSSIILGFLLITFPYLSNAL